MIYIRDNVRRKEILKELIGAKVGNLKCYLFSQNYKIVYRTDEEVKKDTKKLKNLFLDIYCKQHRDECLGKGGLFKYPVCQECITIKISEKEKKKIHPKCDETSMNQIKCTTIEFTSIQDTLRESTGASIESVME